MSRQGDDHLVSRFSHAFPQVFSFILKKYSKKSLDFDHFFVHKQQLPGPEGEAVRELFAQRRILILARLLEKLLTAHKVYIYIYMYTLHATKYISKAARKEQFLLLTTAGILYKTVTSLKKPV